MQTFNTELMKTWRKECDESHIFRRLHAIDPNMPSKKFLNLIAKWSCTQSSIIIQLRTGRIALNRHLHQLSRSNSPDCPHRPHVEETVRHYLFICPKYWKERMGLLRALRRHAFYLKTLLSDPKAQPHLLRYIKKTKRFEELYGSTLSSWTGHPGQRA
jgi:hypothetical protein